MYALSYFTLASALLGSALAHPAQSSHNATLATRDTCPEGAWCGDCYASGSCGSLAVTVGVSPDIIGVGNFDLTNIANMLANQCYTYDSNDGLKRCYGTPITFPVSLVDGDQGTVSVQIDTTEYPVWAENLFHDAILATLQATAQVNTQTIEFQPDTVCIDARKIPKSISVARLEASDQVITLSISVVDIQPEPSSICSIMTTIAATFVGLIPEVGAPAAAAITLGSIFCSS